MFKTTLFRVGLQFEEELYIGEGFNFNTDAFQLSERVVVGHKRIYHYRRDNDESAMTKFNIKKIHCAILAIKHIDQKLVNRDKYTLNALKFANWHTNCDMLFFILLGKAETEYPDTYKSCYTIARRDALVALKVPTSNKEKIRAIITWIYPKTIAYLIYLRRIYHNLKQNR